MTKPRVAWIMGSDSDLAHLEGGIELMRNTLDIPCEVRVLSAHRTPRELSSYLDGAAERGVEVIIAGAGWAAALAGVAAAHTTLPVIGIPIPSSTLSGLDAILSTLMMPGGVPVATMSLGSAGAKNGALFAASILARGDEALTRKLADYKASMAETVLAKDAAVQARFGA